MNQDELIRQGQHIAHGISYRSRIEPSSTGRLGRRALLLFVWIWICGSAPGVAQDRDSTAAIAHPPPSDCTQFYGSEVLTRDEIMAGGLARLSDILHWADRWHSATIDGYTWHAQTSGLSPLSNPRWDVIIDGIPADIGLFGTQSLDALPINIGDIECVEFVARPHAAAGELRQNGAIHLRTRRPDAGATIGGSVSALNEVNDPGPFSYTPLASRNVDRIGPIGTGAIEVRSRGQFARLSAKVDEFHFTDEQVDLRAKVLYNADSKPRIYTRAIAFSAGSDSRWGSHRLLAGRSETNDLLFFETFGAEIPSKRRLEFAGASGSFRIGGGELLYRGRYVSHELIERQNSADVDLDFQTRAISGGLAGRFGSEIARLTIGGSLDFVEALTNQIISDTLTMITRVYGRADTRIGGRVEASIFGSWMQVDDRPGISVSPSVRVTYYADHWVGAGASFARRALAMDASLWRWTQFGYMLPEYPVVEDDVPLPEEEGQADDLPTGRIDHFDEWPAPRLFTTDLEFGGRVPIGIDYLVGGYFRRSLGDYLAAHDIEATEDSTGFRTNTTLVNYLWGDLIGFHASVGLRLLPGFSQRISFVAESVQSAHPLFAQSQARVPSQRLAFTVTYAPNDRFSLLARARYQASSTWSEYQHASFTSEGFYQWVLPPQVLLDIAATKRFWRDHIVANVSVRNLLNEPYRAHPAGAIFNMSFHFALRVSFNSEAGF